MLPRPNKNKKQKLIAKRGNRVTVQAEVFGYDGCDEVPGGAGGFQAIFTKNLRDREHWNWTCKDFEKDLRKFGEELGVRNYRRSLHQRTDNNR